MSNTPENKKEQEDKDSGRRDFLRMGILAAGLTLAGGGLRKVFTYLVKYQNEKSNCNTVPR